MPVQHTRLNENDVRSILRRRGYAFHSQHGVGMRLTTVLRGAKSIGGGRHERTRLIPISPAHLREVLEMSSNEEQAADVIEKLSLGQLDAPQFAHPAAATAAPSFDPQQMQRMVQNAVANESAKYQSQIGELQAQLKEAKRELAAAKKPTRKRRSKKAAVKKPVGEPTPEEQKVIDELLASEKAELDQVVGED